MTAPNLILVGGTYKGGTKSLFKYLGAHPRICPSHDKEPGYFLPPAFGFGNRISFETHDLASYWALFDVHPDHAYVVEATPVYLYSLAAAHAVNARFPNARVVFCLRDPIERLRSWHSMLRHLRRIPDRMTFSDYVEEQMGGAHKLYGFPARGLRDGCYVDALAGWRSALGQARCSVVWFDDLREGPLGVMNQLCTDLQISAAPYENYVFEAHNRAVYLKQWWLWEGYLRLKALAARHIEPTGRLRDVLRQARLQFERRYEMLINRPVHHEPLQTAVEQRLIEYYRDDVQELVRVVGRQPPWLARYA